MSEFSLFGELTEPDIEIEPSTGTLREPSTTHDFPDESGWWIVKKTKRVLKGAWKWIRARLGLISCSGSVCLRVGPRRGAVYEIQQGNELLHFFGVRLYFCFQNINECCGKFLYAKRDGVIAIEKDENGFFVAKHGPNLAEVDSDFIPDPGIRDSLDPRVKNAEGRLAPAGSGKWDDTPSFGLKQFPYANYEARSSITLWVFVKDECQGKIVDAVRVLIWLRLVVQNGVVQHDQSGCKIQILEGRECGSGECP